MRQGSRTNQGPTITRHPDTVHTTGPAHASTTTSPVAALVAASSSETVTARRRRPRALARRLRYRGAPARWQPRRRQAHPVVGKNRTLEAPEHRAALVAKKSGARDSKGRERLRAEIPRIDELLRLWLEDGRYVGSLVGRTCKLLDLYGSTVLTAAVEDLLTKGSHDYGALAILCEKRRACPRRVLPIELAPHVVDRDVIPMTSEFTMTTTTTNDPVELLRALGFRASAEALRALLAHATKSKLSPAEMCIELATLEKRERDARNLEARTRDATLGPVKPLDRFDWTHPREVDRELYEELLESLGFIARGENVIFRGQAGVGKSTLAKHLGLAALAKGHTVRFVTLAGALAYLLRLESIPAIERRLRRYMRLSIDLSIRDRGRNSGRSGVAPRGRRTGWQRDGATRKSSVRRCWRTCPRLGSTRRRRSMASRRPP